MQRIGGDVDAGEVRRWSVQMRKFDQRKAGTAADIEAADAAADFKVIEQQRAKARAPERGLIIDFSRPWRHPAGRVVQEVTHQAASWRTTRTMQACHSGSIPRLAASMRRSRRRF